MAGHDLGARDFARVGMPISKSNRALYPKGWPTVREAILKRAGHRCEWDHCGARNYSVGWWVRTVAGDWCWAPAWGQNDNPRTYTQARQRAAELYFERSEEGAKPIVIVLTIAHLDHDPTHGDPERLAAYCQRHHLAYDHEHHMANAQRTRRAHTPELF